MSDTLVKVDPTSTDPDAWDFDAMPMAGNALALALWPEKALRRPVGRKRIENGMRGVQKHFVVDLDGFGYDPDFSHFLDMNLVMVAVQNDNVVVLEDWVGRFGADILNHRNSELWSPLAMAVSYKADRVLRYLRGIDEVEIGLPEAAALGETELTRRLVMEYNARPHPWNGLRGEDVAYLFSALSGNIEWVEEWQQKVDDINVTLSKYSGNALGVAVRSGSKELVQWMYKRGVDPFPAGAECSLAHLATKTPDMFRYVMETFKIGADTLSGVRSTLLETALLNRDFDLCLGLIQSLGASAWAGMSMTHPLGRALFRWHSPATCALLLKSVSAADMKMVLRQALREGNYQLVAMMVDAGADLTSKHDRLNPFTTLLEDAVASGSCKTVKLVLEMAPNSWDFCHDNGFNCLVCAARIGSASVFRAIFGVAAQKFLDRPVWGGRNLLHIAAQYHSQDIFELMLDPEFYDKHCRGKFPDVNTRDDNGRSVLWVAISSGDAALVDMLLSRREWLCLKECTVPSEVNSLIEFAASRNNFGELIHCFSRHGFGVTEVPSSSLAMKAAENGALFVGDPSLVERLNQIDKSFSIGVSAELFLRAAISNAPKWAIEIGQLKSFVQWFLTGPVETSSWSRDRINGGLLVGDELVLEQVVRVADLDFSGLLAEKLVAYIKKDPLGAILLAIGESKDNTSPKHPQEVRRRTEFVRWLIEQVGEIYVAESEDAAKILGRLVGAGIPFASVKSLFRNPIQCSAKQLTPILFRGARMCQLETLKALLPSISNEKVVELRDDDEEDLLMAALSTKNVRSCGSGERFSLVKFLLETYNFDPMLCNGKGQDKSAVTQASKLGNEKIHELMRQFFKMEDLRRSDIQSDRFSLLKSACESGHPRIVAWVLDSFGDLMDIAGKDGETAVHLACQCRQISVLRFLVNIRGMDPNKTDAKGRTPSFYAQFLNNGDVFEFLARASPGAPRDDSPTNSPLRKVQEHLNEIGRSIGKTFRLDHHGICAFTYEDYTVVIEVPHTVGTFFLYCSVGAIDPEIELEAQTMLLELANPDNSAEICPSIDKSDASVTLSTMRRVEETSCAEFRDFLEGFIDNVLAIGQRIQALQTHRLICSKLQSTARQLCIQGSHPPNSLTVVADIIGTFILPAVENKKKLSQPETDAVTHALKAHLKEISAAVGKNLLPNESGQTTFTYEDLLIQICPSAGISFRITAIIWAGAPSVRVLRQALEGNYLQQETRGGKLFLSANSNFQMAISFCYEDGILPLSPRDFRNILENFIDCALKWRKELAPQEETTDCKMNSGSDEQRCIDWLKDRQGTLAQFAADPDTLFNAMLMLPPEQSKESVKNALLNIADACDHALWQQAWQSAMKACAPEVQFAQDANNCRCDGDYAMDDAHEQEQLVTTMKDTAQISSDCPGFAPQGRQEHIPKGESSDKENSPNMEIRDSSEVLDAILNVAMEKKVADRPILVAMCQQLGPDIFVAKCVQAVSISKRLVESHEAEATLKLIIEIAGHHGWTWAEDTPLIDDWNMKAANMLNAVSSQSTAKHVLACFDILFQNVPDTEETMRRCVELLNLSAFSGYVAIMQFFLDRYSSLKIAEQTLAWACKQENHEMAQYILAKAPGISRNQALMDAVFLRSTETLKILGVGPEHSTSPGEEEHSEATAALSDAARTAIAGSRWDALELLLSDPRLQHRISGLLGGASSFPKRALDVIADSGAFRRTIYSVKIPWEAQASMQKHLVKPVLLLGKTFDMPQEITQCIWQYSRPLYNESPMISTSGDLHKMKCQLEKDLGTGFSRIGNVTFGNNHIRVRKIFDVGGAEIKHEDLLEMCANLGGCFLTLNSKSTVHMHYKLMFGGCSGARYVDVLRFLHTFTHTCEIVAKLFNHYKEMARYQNPSTLAFLSPSLLEFTNVHTTYETMQRGQNVTVSIFQKIGLARLSICINGGDAASFTLSVVDRRDNCFVCYLGGESNLCLFVPLSSISAGVKQIGTLASQL